MTPSDFRELAFRFPETEERAHMNHPDFRVAGKTFATLGYPNKERAMLKITPVEQEMLMRAEPSVFTPVKGTWGLKGCTNVNLGAAEKTTLHRAIAALGSSPPPRAVPSNLQPKQPQLSSRHRTARPQRSLGKKSADR